MKLAFAQMGALALASLFSLIALSTAFLPTSSLIRTSTLAPKIDCDLPKKYDLKKPAVNNEFLAKLWERLEPYKNLTRVIATVPGYGDYVLPGTCDDPSPINLIRSHGYKVDKVKITSEDGFILTAWRIQCRKNCGDDKYPVLLQHGLFCSGADWLLLEPEYILPYHLADNGYEVWIGNARGTQYSQEHEKAKSTHNPKDKESEYWKHSVHEMGIYDVPATIDAMKKMTNKDKVNYVGYSMGTTMFFIYASEIPDHYAKNVNRFVGLAPAMFIHNFATQFRYLALVLRTETFHHLFSLVGKAAQYETDGPLKYSDGIKNALFLFNKIAPYFVPVLKNVLDWETLGTFLDAQPYIKNVPTWQRALGQFPENISIRTLRHYIQFFAKKVFSKFDFSCPCENNKNYGTVVPPLYNVGNIKVPSLFIGGAADTLVVRADADYTYRQIQKCPSGGCAMVKYNLVPCFNHLDFIWGPGNATKTLIYDQILKWFDRTWDESYWPDIKETNETSTAEYCMERYLKT